MVRWRRRKKGAARRRQIGPVGAPAAPTVAATAAVPNATVAAHAPTVPTAAAAHPDHFLICCLMNGFPACNPSRQGSRSNNNIWNIHPDFLPLLQMLHLICLFSLTLAEAAQEVVSRLDAN